MACPIEGIPAVMRLITLLAAVKPPTATEP